MRQFFFPQMMLGQPILSNHGIFVNSTLLRYCLWKNSCTTWDVKNLVNNGINYQPQLVNAGFLPSTVCRSCFSKIDSPQIWSIWKTPLIHFHDPNILAPWKINGERTTDPKNPAPALKSGKSSFPPNFHDCGVPT